MSIYHHFSEQELAILQERADRAASTEEKNTTEFTLTILNIVLGSETYALSIERLRAVYKDAVVVSIPCTPSYIAGMTNLRGQITPVLDLAALLNISSSTSITRSLVIISQDDLTLALQVDEIGEIETFPVSAINPLPTGGKLLDREGYLQGLFLNGPTLLNIDAILNDSTLVVDYGTN